MAIGQLGLFLSTIILSSFSLALLIICLLFLLECIAAVLPSKRLIPALIHQKSWQNIEVAVLVPAHNEELAIANTLDRLIPVLKSQDRLVVVADNCDDNTAEISRAKGVTVIERDNHQLRGKGYALDYGIQFLQNNPPDVVVIIDADCTVKQEAIEKLSEFAIATGNPVQGTYLMIAAKNSQSSKNVVSQLANIVRNLVRPLGLYNLGQSSLLNGTGMAFPWDVINTVNLATGHLVEDLKLGLDLTIAGYKCEFCQAARVTAYFPQNSQASKSQKTRWVHGHLQTIQTYVPILIKQAVLQKKFNLLISALDLCILPLSLLSVIWLGMTISSIMFGFAVASWIPSLIVAISGLCLFTAIFIAWVGFAAKELPLAKFLSIPLYVISKMPIYFNFLMKQQKNWIRTQRD